jgi:predicted transcriptional regulator
LTLTGGAHSLLVRVTKSHAILTPTIRQRRTLTPDPAVLPDPSPLLYTLLYGQCMSKSVTIRVPEELHAQLQEQAEAEGTTVTALITEAARNAARDPRLDRAADVFRAFVAANADAFDAAFPDDAPAQLDASGHQGRAA